MVVGVGTGVGVAVGTRVGVVVGTGAGVVVGIGAGVETRGDDEGVVSFSSHSSHASSSPVPASLGPGSASGVIHPESMSDTMSRATIPILPPMVTILGSIL